MPRPPSRSGLTRVTHGCRNALNDGELYVCMYVCMDIFVCENVCMYVCMCAGLGVARSGRRLPRRAVFFAPAPRSPPHRSLPRQVTMTLGLESSHGMPCGAHGMYVCMYVCDRSEADLGPHTSTYPIHQSPFCAPLDCSTHSSYSILRMPEGWHVCMYVC